LLPSRAKDLINNEATVAFWAELSAGGDGIFVGSGGPVLTIADSSGPFRFFDSSPSINDSGSVAFLAALDAGGEGIFPGSDPVAARVIGTGDLLSGSTVTGLIFFRGGLNDAGQVAFFAFLAEDRRVIVRADPVAIPAPSALTLLGLGAIGLIAYARRRSKALAANELLWGHLFGWPFLSGCSAESARV
jgi:hypothetical protein